MLKHLKPVGKILLAMAFLATCFLLLAYIDHPVKKASAIECQSVEKCGDVVTCDTVDGNCLRVLGDNQCLDPEDPEAPCPEGCFRNSDNHCTQNQSDPGSSDTPPVVLGESTTSQPAVLGATIGK